MKLLIVSDSHGWSNELADLKARHEADTNAFIHCGDSELPASSPFLDGYTIVRGNCDADSSLANEQIKRIGHLTLYVTHGHLYSVKSSLMNLAYRAGEIEADIVCFGHSHLVGAELFEGTLFLNPGSIRMPRGRQEKTYMILQLIENRATVLIHQLDGTELVELRQNFTLPKSI